MQIADYPIVISQAIAILINAILFHFTHQALSEVEMASLVIVVQGAFALMAMFWTRSKSSLRRENQVRRINRT